ncbi:helix-turn-helix domain-containing protein [Vibrio parahaemolyticus]|uniref:helix-turn-helix domain-containing protein n=1 Tax=Vibrio parahaemolyticus TaxID=670 RepID=UPI001E3463CA|nr:helix-turn-helix domain-containing protein [Vibrio parahaemolyticus]
MTNQFSITKEIAEAKLRETHNVTPTEKLVLLCLSGYFGKPDNSSVFSCYPSQDRLAGEVGCVRSTVNNALQKLEKLGFISSRYRTNDSGGNTSKLYTWKGIPKTEEQEENEDSNESSGLEVNVLETQTAISDESTMATITESPSQARRTELPEWWSDLEAVIEADQSPF